MFDIKQFTKDNLIGAFKDDIFTEEQVNIFCVNYLIKGVFDEADIVEVIALMNPIIEEV
ncbi:MAG TPA: hypothetical protein VFC41_04790 [Anaerovoracaceae bacterium]|nr:hypothetical protein [Anaerovoracaceae bacterium]